MVSAPAGTVSSQGVRQLWPSVVRASAPGGSDSIRNVSLAGADLKNSRLGIDIAQPATVRPHATTAITRLMVVPTLGSLRPPMSPVGSTIRSYRPRRNRVGLPSSKGIGARISPKWAAVR